MDLKPAHPAEMKIDTNPDSPWEGSISVEAGYYGLVDYERIAWAAELVTREQAEFILKHQDRISEIVAAHGGRARIRISIEDRTVTEYDFRRWTEAL